MQSKDKELPKVTFSQYNRDLLVFCPTPPHRYHHVNMSKELEVLKNELKQLGLIEKSDYVIDVGPYPNTSPDYNVTFTGPFRVLRAMNAIVNELAKEKSPWANQLAPWAQGFALALSESDCKQEDQPIKEEVLKIKEAVDQHFFKNICDQINNVHKDIKKPSKVIAQLKQDLEVISKRPEEKALEGKSNFYLALAALYHAINTEKNAPTVVEKGFGIMKDIPILLNDYKEVFGKFSSKLVSCKDWDYKVDKEVNYQILNGYYKDVGAVNASEVKPGKT